MSRTSQQTVQCKGCRRIYVNALWMRERREYHVTYRVSVCPQCIDLGGHRPLPREYTPPPRNPGRI
ncbi:hypothetical protein METEAL_20040 [Mesoterricola silvestris]|uniref:Uncharacterized protein n=1 Tax=Mesoterricola silvestris TaxID=2927979 RepID=A0AA48K974_9BACT|nr:hypothetical protein METEAL_20040 [Mesoterricola silvestris]